MTSNKEPKILIWDLETSDLSADIGFIICVSYQWLGESKIHTISLLDYPKTFKKNCTDDFYVVRDFLKVFEQADAHVAHFGTYFDPQYFQTRLFDHRKRFKYLPVLPPIPLDDTWLISKKKLKMHSNRLQSLTEFAGFESKTLLNLRIWKRARAGHVPSIRYVIEHCVQDIKVLTNLYSEIRPLSPKNVPNYRLWSGNVEACPRCGVVGRLHRRGYQRSTVIEYARLQCQACGKWCSAPFDKNTGKIKIDKIKGI